MAWRPRPAHWFELLVARDDLAAAMNRLAAAGCVELEGGSQDEAEATQRQLIDQLLARYRDQAERFRRYWPEPASLPGEIRGRPARVLAAALATLEQWAEDTARLIDELEHAEAERNGLAELRPALQALNLEQLDLRDCLAAGPLLSVALLHMEEFEPSLLPADGLALQATTDGAHYLLLVGTRAALADTTRRLESHGARLLPLPELLAGNSRAALTRIDERLRTLDETLRRLRAALADSHRNFGVADALGRIAQIRWFMESTDYFPLSETLAWVRGWTLEESPGDLQTLLSRHRIRALAHFPPPPADAVPPLALANPPWLRPFELFVRLFGMPGRTEADPTPLLALSTPLMFGYMFGDVGQGLLILIAGLTLSRRWPAARILVPAGIAAMLFGLAFGSLFAREDLLPALWLHPLESPLQVLAIPLAGGALLLGTGVLLSLLEALWQQRLAHWLVERGPAVTLWLASLAAVVAAPIAWFLIGVALTLFLAGISPRLLAARLAGVVESLFQLAVNTLSFARVGAFALAHAGLGATLAALATAVDSSWTALAIYLVGNLVIVALEGTIVAIQTTRLVLFEFFVRFLEGRGRPFRPLRPPAAATGGVS